MNIVLDHSFLLISKFEFQLGRDRSELIDEFIGGSCAEYYFI